MLELDEAQRCNPEEELDGKRSWEESDNKMEPIAGGLDRVARVEGADLFKLSDDSDRTNNCSSAHDKGNNVECMVPVVSSDAPSVDELEDAPALIEAKPSHGIDKSQQPSLTEPAALNLM